MKIPALKHYLAPTGASEDAHLLLTTRGIRAFGDGFVSVLLPVYLTGFGFSGARIGVIAMATLLGSAALTLAVGMLAFRYPRRRLLIRAAVLMIVTGLAFTFVHGFWPLVVVGFFGTLNPSSGDVSIFLPTEHALLPQTVSDANRTALFGRYTMIGALVAAFGALTAGLPEIVTRHSQLSEQQAMQGMFLLYALLGVICLLLYRDLTPAVEPDMTGVQSALGPSKHRVYRLAALFSIDALGGGFVIQSMLSLWLFQKFDLSVATAGAIFFWTGVLAAFSAPVSVRLGKRFGLINTAVFTHLPANLLLIATPFMPSLPLAVACLLVRAALSSMDVPVRNSYVMAVVTPSERPAAASVTAVPRSFAAALGAGPAGYLLGVSTFGWPLVIGGSLKVVYDVLLLRGFKRTLPPEEQENLKAAG